MKNLIYDTETCGLHGLAVLIQYKYNNDPIKLFNVWTEQVIETLKLIEWMMEQDNIGFNLAFDHFHLSKLYTIWSLLPPHEYPEDIIDLVAAKEPLGRDGFCIKPNRACDLMLWARKGKYQDTMQRKDIKIKKVHRSVADDVRYYLELNVRLDDIYFANRKNKYAPRWAIYNSKEGEEWKDIVLKFKPSGALKTLAVHALGHDPKEVLRYGEIDVPQYPIEVGYAPFALAISSGPDWRAKVRKGSGWKRGVTWPAVIHLHISHWLNNRLARQYAEDDVKYTEELFHHLKAGIGDNDSELACMVGANRWRGYSIDINKLDNLKLTIEQEAEAAPKAPNNVRRFITEVMTPDEKEMFDLVAEGSTKKVILENLRDTWGGKIAERAGMCLKARQAKYRLDMINKLKTAGRFHAAAEIIGALSGRKSGSGGDFNSQGIGRQKEIRECFTLAPKGMRLCGGDFESFEITIAIAVYHDSKMADIVTSKKKIHAVFGTFAYPPLTYEQMLEDKEKYTRAKSGLFALIYFGEAYTLKKPLGISDEDAEACYQMFMKEFPKTAEGRQRVVKMFQSMQQPNGRGTKVYWNEPADKIETLFAFPRFFTLENKICKALYFLANKIPQKWKMFDNIKVKRRDTEQTVLGAIQSALYAAAFAIQGSNTRAGGNHEIQGSGAHITKQLERNIWDMQPVGINPWVVQPMNEHDEVMCPCVPEKIDLLNDVVKNTLDMFRPKVPLISIDWHNNMGSWADK